MSQGWVKTYRSLLNHSLWLSEKFTRGQAWIDLILLANHADGFIYVRGNKVNVQRGQVGWSQKRLAERWQWSRTKVKKFLNDLENDQQITQQNSNISSVITLSNYESYQDSSQQIKQQKSNRKESVNQQEYTNKNEKKNTESIKPHLEDLISFFVSNGYKKETAITAFQHYEDIRLRKGAAQWIDSRGNPIMNWRLKMSKVWFKSSNKDLSSSNFNADHIKSFNETSEIT